MVADVTGVCIDCGDVDDDAYPGDTCVECGGTYHNYARVGSALVPVDWRQMALRDPATDREHHVVTVVVADDRTGEHVAIQPGDLHKWLADGREEGDA